MTQRQAWAVAAAAALAAVVGLAWWRSPPGYKTPEGAAFVASMQYLEGQGALTDSLHVARLFLNVPRQSQSTPDRVASDIATYASQVVVLRDTAWYAHSVVPPESIKAYGTVYDVRKAHGPGDVDLAFGEVEYHVGSEECRGWPCHSGHVAAVRRTVRGYKARVVSVWVE